MFLLIPSMTLNSISVSARLFQNWLILKVAAACLFLFFFSVLDLLSLAIRVQLVPDGPLGLLPPPAGYSKSEG
jgi:hypothetical protein